MNSIKWTGESRYRVQSDLLPIGHEGIRAQQNPNAFQMFDKFFQENEFDFVIEIGTSFGGFALYLYEQSLQHDFNFITYDYSKFKGGIWSDRRRDLKDIWDGELKYDFRDKDVFLDDTIKEISTILQNNKCLLLCDGGDKPREIQIYSEYLQPGSYIMGHDYSPSKEYHQQHHKGKVWNWLELMDSDVKKTMEQYGLTKSSEYYQGFCDVVWLCLIKE